MTIMIVDDNPGMRKMIRMIVAGRSDEVVECAGGAEAVDAYPRIRPDWVLMDLAMKPMDGLDATMAILQCDPGASVVIVTQHDDPGFRRRAREAGALRYILKKNLHELISIIHPN